MLANVAYNYAAQVVLAVAGLVTLPFLLGRMGPELYAFVAIHYTLQMVFSMLDGGLSGSLAREFALRRSAPAPAQDGRALLRRMEPIYLALAGVGFTALFLASGAIADRWLRLSTISRLEAGHFIGLIAAIAAIRLASGLYRSVLVGCERQKALSLVDIGSTLSRQVLVLWVLDRFGMSGDLYFAFQLGVSVVEILVLRGCALAATTPSAGAQSVPDGAPVSLTTLFQRSVQIWVLSIIWVLTVQWDKLLLAGYLPLQELGYFSVVSSLTGGLLMLGSPIISAAMPRMALFQQAADWEGFQATYLRASVLLACVATPLCLAMVASPAHALFLLTNDAAVASRYAWVLACYAFGGLMLLLSGTTFLLQYAAGRLGANIRMNLVYLLLLTPAMAVGVHFRGAEGAAWAWLSVNLLQGTLIIVPLNRIAGRSVHAQWLRSVVASPLLVSAPWLAGAILFTPELASRGASLAWLAAATTGFALPMAWRLNTWRRARP